MNTLGGLSGGIRWGDCKRMKQFSKQESLRTRSSVAARGLRRKEEMYLFRFPALAPQRDLRLGGRAGLLSVVPAGTPDTQRTALKMTMARNFLVELKIFTHAIIPIDSKYKVK